MTEAEPCRCTWSEVLQYDIGAADETIEDLGSIRVLEIEGHAALAAVQPDKEAGLAVHESVVGPREVALPRALDFDDVGA
jgi:hypothetical protein